MLPFLLTFAAGAMIAVAARELLPESVKENKNLEQLRDTLLPKLMNGEIDLENMGI